MEYIFETCGLTKSYMDKKVVDKVNMHIRKGEIYGFVGPNGAGKSTMMKMIMNLVQPDSGNRIIFGQKILARNFDYLRKIGSLIENPYFYGNMDAKTNLEIHCAYMGYKNVDEIEKVLNLVGLGHIGKKLVKQFSLGMKQRLAIGRAILSKPELLILDEPVNALDPEGIKDIRALLKRLKQEQGCSILISSHILSEVEMMADTIGIIRDGKLLEESSIQNIFDGGIEYIQLEVDNVEFAKSLLEEKANIRKCKITSENKIQIMDANVSTKIISAILVKNDIGLISISKHKNTLEDYFMQLVQKRIPD